MKIEKAQEAKTEEEVKELKGDAAGVAGTGVGVIKEEEEAAKKVAREQVRKTAKEDLKKNYG